MVRHSWSKNEDVVLLNIIKNLTHPIDWNDVDKQMQNNGLTKTLKQAKTRYLNHLCPGISKKEWKPVETKLLFQVYLKYKNKWKKISSQFNGRSDNCIKNHFFSVIRKSLRTATKLLGNEDMSSTDLIKQIKPKVLADFLSQSFPCKKTNKEYKIIDFINKYAFTNHNDLIQENDETEKELVSSCIEFLLKMNAKYTGGKTKGKRITKRKSKKNSISFQSIKDNTDPAVLFPGIHERRSVRSRNSNLKKTYSEKVLKQMKQLFGLVDKLKQTNKNKNTQSKDQICHFLFEISQQANEMKELIQKEEINNSVLESELINQSLPEKKNNSLNCLSKKAIKKNLDDFERLIHESVDEQSNENNKFKLSVLPNSQFPSNYDNSSRNGFGVPNLNSDIFKNKNSESRDNLFNFDKSKSNRESFEKKLEKQSNNSKNFSFNKDKDLQEFLNINYQPSNFNHNNLPSPKKHPVEKKSWFRANTDNHTERTNKLQFGMFK